MLTITGSITDNIVSFNNTVGFVLNSQTEVESGSIGNIGISLKFAFSSFPELDGQDTEKKFELRRLNSTIKRHKLNEQSNIGRCLEEEVRQG
jgi:hypothetical protein